MHRQPVFSLQPVIDSGKAIVMESDLKQISPSVFAIIGAEGATNTIIKNREGSAVLIDADIRRIDEIETALQFAGCSKASYLLDTMNTSITHRRFLFCSTRHTDHFASSGCVGAMRDNGEHDFERMMKPVPDLVLAII